MHGSIKSSTLRFVHVESCGHNCKDGSEQHCAGYVCDDLSQVSAHLYAAGTELPGGDVIVPGGLASVLDTMVNIIPGDVIKTGKKVTNIDWSGPDVVVTTNSGKFYKSKYILKSSSH